MATYFIGIDVGTGSARAGVFDMTGRMVGQASREITLYRPKADFVEQSSDEIWQSVCNAVKDAVNQADINPIQVKGIGFDATCSLVVLDKEGKPLTVSPSGRSEQNIIVWMDHRAITQAERINATGHRVLEFVGGIISPEMQTPKLLWLKQHMPTTWSNVGHLFDLPDFLPGAPRRTPRVRCALPSANGPISVTKTAGTRAISARSVWKICWKTTRQKSVVK